MCLSAVSAQWPPIVFRDPCPASATLLGVRPIRTSWAVSAVVLATAAPTLLSGCASPGNPRAPSLHLQQVPQPPQAERLGDQVVLTWTTPDSTTDGGRALPPLTAVICRQSSPGRLTPCAPVLRIPVTPGASGRAAETLPPSLIAAPTLLAYQVAIENRRGRSAGFSQPAFAAGGPAPAPAGPLTIISQPGGALVTWAGVASNGTMELTRTPVAPPPTPNHSAQTLGSDPSAPVLLRPSTNAPAGRDGMLDPAVLDPRLDATAFRYVAQRVATIKLGSHALELRGLPSPPAVFTYAHAFAPAAPAGLIAIPALNPPAIDLSWEASASPDLLGYNIYRRGPSESAFLLLNARPIALPSFRDLAVQPGRIYTYRVTALDRHHNQSGPSAELQESVTP